MGSPGAEPRAVEAIERVCSRAGSGEELFAALSHEVRKLVPFDGSMWFGVDPATLLAVAPARFEALDEWLNVPYDSGYAFCADADAHAAAMSYAAAYLTGQGQGRLRAPSDYVLESSRRARGFATWAALRQLGRKGVAELIERCCSLARRFAQQLANVDGVSVANDVVLNQVLVSFGDEDRTDRVIDRIQASGECWMGATTWHDQRLMRISVSNWRTTEADVDRSVAAILAASEREPPK